MRTLALHQWRRNKGSFLGFGAIILIAACMLGSALTLLCTVGPRYTALADELHTADVDIVVSRTAATADVRDVIDRTTGVGTIEPHAVLLMDAQIHDFRGTDFAIRTMITDADAQPNARAGDRRRKRGSHHRAVHGAVRTVRTGGADRTADRRP